MWLVYVCFSFSLHVIVWWVWRCWSKSHSRILCPACWRTWSSVLKDWDWSIAELLTMGKTLNHNRFHSHVNNRFIHSILLTISLSFILSVCRDIASLATVSLTESFVPKCQGPCKLVASLDCPQLTQVHGACNVVVKKWMRNDLNGFKAF